MEHTLTLTERMQGWYADETPFQVVQLWKTACGEMGIYYFPEKGVLVLGVLSWTGRSHYTHLAQHLDAADPLTEVLIQRAVRNYSVIAEFAGA